MPRAPKGRHEGRHARLRKKLLALAASAALLPQAATALDLTQSPPATVEPYVAPNVIISIDDSGSMRGTITNQNAAGDIAITAPRPDGTWSDDTPRINILKYALTRVFSDTAIVPDGKIRLAWQAMWNNPGGLCPGEIYTFGMNGSPPSTGAGASPGVGVAKSIEQLLDGRIYSGVYIDNSPCANQYYRKDDITGYLLTGSGNGNTLFYNSRAGANSVYSGSGDPAFGANTMQPLAGSPGDGTSHRGAFLSFVNNLAPMQGTPAYWMFSQADAYMRAPLTKNGPWASMPGTKGEPYLACRRAYHIMMTDGRWNMAYSPPPVMDNGTTAFTLGDGATSYGETGQTRIYRDSDPDGTLADWAFYSWARPLQATASLAQLQPDGTAVKPSPDYTSAPPTETIGGVALQKFWNPRFDPATWPHMVTYTIGFSHDAVQWPGNGMPPSCASADDPAECSAVTPFYAYETDDEHQIHAPTQQTPFGQDGDFPKLVSGDKSWPDMGGPGKELNHSLDLWHAAINGRGNFFAVTQPEDLEKAFRQIIQAINTANEPNISAMAASGFNASRAAVGAFIAGYDPARNWAGYVKSMLIQSDGSLADNTGWHGQTTAQKLDAMTAASRVILTWSDKWAGSAVAGGVAFNSLDALGDAQKSLLDADGRGAARIQYLRGERASEAPGGPLRARASIQGDIVNSGVWYTGAPSGLYSMAGYSGFVSGNSGRAPMIYVGGNDGMLHGFAAADGSEKIAYVPRGVMAALSQLSDPAYSHRYYVDGSPMTGDANFNGGGADSAHAASATGGSDWRTVLVGTLGAGGRGYFVLDVTNPDDGFTEAAANSLVLTDRTRGNGETQSAACPMPAGNERDACMAAWEKDKDLGNITATPVLDDTDGLRSAQIALMNNNRWAVVLGNGYNSPNGRPALLIQYLDGAMAQPESLKTIAVTGAGGDNGLSAPRLVDINGDGRADVAYAGDNQGNLWKFDLTSSKDSEWQVAFGGQPLFTARGPAAAGEMARNTPQPISAPPTARANDRMMTTGASAVPNARVGGMMVAFGTGRNVAVGDDASTAVQTLYSVLDNTRYIVNSGDTGLGQRLKVNPGHGSDPAAANYAPAPAALGAGVNEARLAQQMITPVSGAYATLTPAVSLDPATWANYNGWYLDFPAAGERLLQSIRFYDGTNVLSVYSQVPPKSSSDAAPGVESCQDASLSAGVMYMTLINIMDGKAPSIPLIDVDGNGQYDGDDGLVNRLQVDYGPHTQTASGNRIYDTTPNGNPPPPPYRRPPIQTLLPSWRQWQ